MYPVMTPMPTREMWVDFYEALNQLTKTTSTDQNLTYFQAYPEKQISGTAGDDRELRIKEITHYIMHYMAAAGLMIGKAINVLSLSRISGILYSDEVAATLRFSTFNTILRSIQGTPMPSWVYDGLFSIAKLFISDDPESGITVYLPFFMNCDEAWLDLPTMFGSLTHPIGGVDRRPPFAFELSNNGEFVDSGTWNGATQTALTGMQTFEPVSIYSSVDALLKSSSRWHDTLSDWMILELAAAVDYFRTCFAKNSNKKLNFLGASQHKDTVMFWNELGILDGQFDVGRFFNDVNAIGLFDYSSLQQARDRQIDLRVRPIPKRDPASLLDGSSDYASPSHSLLRPFTFVTSAESYPGEKRIAFDLDLDSYWNQVAAQVKGGDAFVDSLPEEIPYCGFAATDADEIYALVNGDAFPAAPTLLNYIDPGSSVGTGGFTSSIITAMLYRMDPDTQTYVSPEEKDLIASWLNSQDEFFLSEAMLRDGAVVPLPRAPQVFNPADIYQHGEFLVADLRNRYAVTGSWEKAVVAGVGPTSDFSDSKLVLDDDTTDFIYRRSITEDGNDTGTAYLSVTDAQPLQNSKIRDYVGLTWIFVGDAALLTPAAHFRRHDIALAAIDANEPALAGYGCIAPYPVRLHTDYVYDVDFSIHASQMALEGLTMDDGVLTVDVSDADWGQIDPAVLDIDRAAYPYAVLVPGFQPCLRYPVRSRVLFALRPLMKAKRVEASMAAIRFSPAQWCNEVAPTTEYILVKGTIDIRRRDDNKAGGRQPHTQNRPISGRRPGRSFGPRPDASSPIDQVEKTVDNHT
jgi:hypothetical protein